MINTIGIALSGLQGAAKRVEASAANIANMHTAGALPSGSGPAPYSAVTTAQNAAPQGGITTTIIPKDPAFIPAYDPNSPFADAQGMIGAPNVNLAEEAVNMTLAKTAYRANIAIIKTADEMQDELLKTFDRKA